MSSGNLESGSIQRAESEHNEPIQFGSDRSIEVRQFEIMNEEGDSEENILQEPVPVEPE